MKDFDELLDSVLRDDAAPQPRAGLEARVMARVRTEERLPRGLVLRCLDRWRGWLFVPAAACLAMIAVWYVADRGVPQPERTASRVSAPALMADSALATKTVDDSRNLGGSGRALRDAHLRRDETAPKMGHPVLRSARYLRSETRRVESAPEDEPKLETFPAVSQKGDVAGWLVSGDDGKLAAMAREVTPAVAAAFQQLQAVQSGPIDIAAIEIEPLQ